ncbi:hypothetical protein C6P40_000041 [Pichia californica]|uniref:Zn(2)-C6 fungal-type domain-containing protein n=1 Tax=Pichia californica TaxID=460514 RepID=A0A9P6WQK5_9ASCO|nr:hypothetical protein C6P40_000041 [[Candida] californica]
MRNQNSENPVSKDDDNNDYKNNLIRENISQLDVRRHKRKHNKSRDGCLACKERKIKCDERIPVCFNCERKGMECPYLMMTPYQIHKIQEHQKNEFSKTSNHKNKNKNMNMNINILNKQEENYQYRPSGTVINLNPKISKTNNDIYYHAHEVENALLKCSMENDFIITNSNNLNSPHIPLTTAYNPTGNDGELIKSNNNNNNIPLYSNTRISNKSFTINNDIINKELILTAKKSLVAYSFFINNDFESLLNGSYGKKLDKICLVTFIWILNIGQIFDKLARKSSILFAMDYYKNIILRQKIIPNCSYKAKLSISCVCENESVNSIDSITRILKDIYIPNFHKFGLGFKNIILGCFLILDDCLGYHFKNGLKYDMSFEEGLKSVQLVGIFSTGMYAIIIGKCHEEILMSITNILSIHFLISFKRFLIKSFNLKILEEFQTIIERISPYFTNDVNYANIKIFCKEHSRLLKINFEKYSLLGFNNGYLIRLFNSFKSIIPFDLNNLFNDDDDDDDDYYKNCGELDIIITLVYITLSEILDAIIPAIKNLVSSRFAGPQLNNFEIDNISKIMKIFNKIKDKKLKIISIYLIRTTLFLKCHWRYYKEFLMDLNIDLILDEDNEFSINQRYEILKNMKE